MIKSEEIIEARIILPLTLIFWVPATICVIATLWGLIAWDIFGNTNYVTEFYTSRFESGMDSCLWILGDMGVVGIIFCVAMGVGYIWLCRQVLIGIFK